MAEQTPLERGKAKALRLLAVRPRTRRQIRERLERDELGETAEEVLKWLERLGYLDDEAFARSRARSLLAPGRLGPRLAERRLITDGVTKEQAAEAISEALQESSPRVSGSAGAQVHSGNAEAELCRVLVEKRLRGRPLASLDEKARARLARFLLGRGFTGRAVASVVEIYADPEE